MESDKIELAERAVACKGWRWMPGMLARSQFRTIRIEHDGVEGATTHDKHDAESLCQYLAAIPDLTDPATLGCLLALVRETWGMPTGITVSYSSDDGLWGVSWSGATHGGWCGRGRTEDEALVAALEGAP